MHHRLVVVACLVVASAIAAPIGAADPTHAKNASTIMIVCPSGTYSAVVNGHGNFTAAHSTTTTQVLIPIAFGEFTGTFTDPAGNVTTSVEPASAKGNSHPANGAVEECTYSFRVEIPDGSVFAGSGGVTGFVTPVR